MSNPFEGLVPARLGAWTGIFSGNRAAKTLEKRKPFAGGFDIDWNSIHYNRIAVINHISLRHGCQSYLEIGCRTNQCFDAVFAADKIGVDPERGGTHRMTSDAFFAQCGDRRFDIVFIDGDHSYEQSRRDAVNALSHLPVGGWLVLHDMFPRNWREAHAQQISEFWTGEVWKVAFDLIQSPDVDFRLLKIDHGVGVVRKVRENARIPDNSLALSEQTFQFFYENIDHLPVVDYETGRAWIENAPRLFDLPYSQDASNNLGMPDVGADLKEAAV